MLRWGRNWVCDLCTDRVNYTTHSIWRLRDRVMWDNYENIQLGPWIIQVKCFCALLLFFQKLFAAGYFWWNYSMAHLFPNKDSTKCAGGSSPFVRKQGIVTLFTNNGIPRKHNAAIVQSPVHVASHLEDFSILLSIMWLLLLLMMMKAILQCPVYVLSQLSADYRTLHQELSTLALTKY